MDLNHRPPAPKAGALTRLATPRTQTNYSNALGGGLLGHIRQSSVKFESSDFRVRHDRDSVALEGFSHLIPFAAGHEIMRQRRRNLTLIRLSRSHFRPDDRHGLCEETCFFMGRESRAGLTPSF